jgi:hypothetical protein
MIFDLIKEWFGSLTDQTVMFFFSVVFSKSVIQIVELHCVEVVLLKLG